MERLLKAINKRFENDTVTFESLEAFLLEQDFKQLDYISHIPEPIEGDYSRNIIQLEPLELVLIYWPPNIESGIHHHRGFFGHVVVLEGTLSNVEYQEEARHFWEHRIIDARRTGILPEQEGVIHKLANTQNKPAVSLHFYYPALEDFEGMRIFCLDQRRIGVLNADATTASWTAPEHHFQSIEKDAFTIGRPEGNIKSHRIHPLIPKPPKVDIIDHITRYYHEQAEHYDSFDLEHKSRRLYIDKINELVAEEVRLSGADHVLHLACGTGRRPQRIQEVSGHTYKMTGVDVSSEMLKHAEERGLICHLGDVLSIDFPPNSFCHITMLYAFGHITSSEDRIAVLQKIKTWLKPGGKFMFDVFHLHNTNEWGPSALQTFNNLNLDQFGYEKGDVFYSKTGGSEVAFLHYFERDEIKDLLTKAGLEMTNIVTIGYAKNSGQIPENDDQGSFFVTATNLPH